MAEADGLSVEDAAIAAAKINFFVRLAWQHYWWPETMDIERRTFRAAWAANTTYAAGEQVFYIADGQYYQAMQPSTGQTPSTGSDGNYTPNLAYWFPVQGCYGGSDYSATGTYVLGSTVRNPTDGLFYGLYRITNGVTVSGAGVAAANGVYVWDGTQYTAANGYIIYLRTTVDLSGNITGYAWQLADNTSTNLYQNGAFVLPEPSPAGTWTESFDGSYDPPPSVAITDPIAGTTPPFTSAYWTVLTPFIRSIDYEQAGETALGLVRFVWPRDPEIHRVDCPLEFALRDDFVQVYGCVNVVWLEFQGRVPEFTNLIYDSTQGYSAGVTRYDTTTGDCWTTLVAVTPGQSPSATPAKWSKVDFPYVLAEYVAQSAYAMMTDREQETPENFSIQQSAGYPLLLVEMDNIERKQGQTRQLNVRSGRRGVAMTPFST